ncbi:MAG: nucleotidyltransferase domain-containing protein [Oligoflexia bacterium]|nr:nucleotidyltransferase domain-containing protein [Oligoflexia bacterium]
MVLAALTAKIISKESMQQLLDNLLSAILKRTTSLGKNGPIQIILFGSAARNQASVYSDIDVLIVVKRLIEIRPTIRLLSGLSCELNCALDIIVVDEEQFKRKREVGGVFFDAWNQGVILFEKE